MVEKISRLMLMKEFRRPCLQIGLITTLFFVSMQPCFAQEKEAKGKDKGTAPTITTPTITTKVISGRVGVIRPDYITIIYKEETKEDGIVTDWEKVFPIDEALKLLHLKRLDALQEGDRIEITYEEENWTDEKGVGRSEIKAKEIRFIGPKKTDLRSGM